MCAIIIVFNIIIIVIALHCVGADSVSVLSRMMADCAVVVVVMFLVQF